MMSGDPPPSDDILAERPILPAGVEFRRAPLVPLAIAATAGVILDRYSTVPFGAWLVLALAGIVGTFALSRGVTRLALLLIFAALAGGHHHFVRTWIPEDDLSRVLGRDGVLIRLRVRLLDEPSVRLPPAQDRDLYPLRFGQDVVLAEVYELSSAQGSWIRASGRVRIISERTGPVEQEEPFAGLHAGDTVELFGMATRPRPPGNPGERNLVDAMLDQRIRADIRVRGGTATVVRLSAGDDLFDQTLHLIRRRATATLQTYLPASDAAIARALLLGDGSAMDQSEWDVYIRTGVVHALAISGQHLAILAGVIWFVLRAFGIRRSRGAWIVVVIIVGYTVLTGLRPSGVRAAVMVCVVCGSLILRRPLIPANAFALAWLVVIALQPTDIFTLGCQLSFLSVFVLVWGLGPWLRTRTPTPLEVLIDETRPWLVRILRRLLKWVGLAYLVTVTIAVVNLPLLMTDQHLVSPVGIIVGPLVVVLTTIALVAGFVLMAIPFLGEIVRWPVQLALESCSRLVNWADTWPGGSFYVPGLPYWWLVGFYLLVGLLILFDRSWRVRIVWAFVVWVAVALLAETRWSQPDELRVTFLAVGHGGCVVVETPDGRTLLYDAGTTLGPRSVARIIAPYLWHRGIRRIDELFLSHADTDHFNGVTELTRRFPVGQVTMTPSFAEKPTPEVRQTLAGLADRQIPIRIAVRGEEYVAGQVRLRVLHPSLVGPSGSENERSLVVAIEHEGHVILLTGDLEKAGQRELLEQPRIRSDVVMAPHHGSRAALPKGFLEWTLPRLIVVSRGEALGNTVTSADAQGVTMWDTDQAGAITLRSHRTGLVAETYRTGERKVVVSGSGVTRP